METRPGLLFLTVAMVMNLLGRLAAQVTENQQPQQKPKVDLFGGSGYENYPDDVTEIPITIETVLWYPLRIWHIAAMVATLFTVVAIILCCCCDCRIPRTKEQIEADKERKKLATKYTQEMNELCFGTAGTRMVVPHLDPSLQKQTETTRITNTAPSTNRKLYLPPK